MSGPNEVARGKMLMAASTVALMVSGAIYFGISSRNDQVEAASLEATMAAEQIYTDFLTANGQDFDACFPPFDPNEDVRDIANNETRTQNWDTGLLVVSASGSMAARADGKVKMLAVREALMEVAARLPSERHLGLMVMGHKGNSKEAGKSISCSAADMLVAPASYESAVFADEVQKMTAVGWNPIAESLQRAAQYFKPQRRIGKQQIFLIVDGPDSCGGNPAEMAANLYATDVHVVVNVIGFGVLPEQEVALARIAEAGGGHYLSAATGDELKARLLQLAYPAEQGGPIEVQADPSKPPAPAAPEVLAETLLNEAAQTAQSPESSISSRVFKAKTDAGLCVSNARAYETKTMTAVANDLRSTKATSPTVLAIFREKMDTRHREVIARLESYRDEMNTYVSTPTSPVITATPQNFVPPSKPAQPAR